LIIRKYIEKDLPAMMKIWNQIVESARAFPNEEILNENTARIHFADQTYCAVAEVDGDVIGLYTLRPNNIGRCSHIANTFYAVDAEWRGRRIGSALVEDSIVQSKNHGFKLIQFNSVLESNIHARHVYERLGFVQIGTIPKGYRLKDGTYENICLYYYKL